MRSPQFSQSGLFVASLLVLVLALSVWVRRDAAPGGRGQVLAAGAASPELQIVSQQRTQELSALLFRAFQADNHLTYSAISNTEAMYGGSSMRARARLTRAPHNLSITYLSGPHCGLQCGYNRLWFWRQDAAEPIRAYAEMQHSPDEMETRRFALMLQNYLAEWRGTDKIDNRKVSIVDLRPFHPAEGAQGPAKRLWIDEATGLTLRLETFNYNMHCVMRSTLTHVNYRPAIAPATFNNPAAIFQAALHHPWVAQEEGEDRQRVAAMTGLRPPQPSWLPPGFKFDSVGVHHCRFSGSAYCASLSRYSDGLNTMTIFVVKNPAGAENIAPGLWRNTKPKPGSHRPGKGREDLAACDFGPGTVVSRPLTHGTLLAVADLPAKVLRQVLDATPIDHLEATPGALTSNTPMPAPEAATPPSDDADLPAPGVASAGVVQIGTGLGPRH